MINLDTELEKMLIVGNLASKVLDMIKLYIKPGISTGELNDICNLYIEKKLNAKSAILNYKGFPKSICTSINEVVCHGIPDNNRYIKEGDILNIDVTIFKDGFYGDTSKMFCVGKVSKIASRLCLVAKKSLYLAIKNIYPGIKLNTIGKIIENFVEFNGFYVVKDYCGHGIGKKFHDNPQVLHYYSDYNNYVLKPGMAITIEPMINTISDGVKLMKDGWTVKTKDHGLSAQYEHTILITKNGYLVTTLRDNEKIDFII
ncbi:type I methionyl aminopeptidase [endosymbiont of Pachyrhynchus infernalis]|uniref:type I methionyl aminopeptidase n=1 Tax=endosymbiont of Pachyrhynchus infernalis TaxID=1971488 RepID=UPI000DC7217F|nr:type I methionyl aminopeptidase [endosymbiont of Pachyrhynchus infernalis]BBA84802.1 methionine aminopeptidase [endosymbiont of Pachyrhynchus infernalis]